MAAQIRSAGIAVSADSAYVRPPAATRVGVTYVFSVTTHYRVVAAVLRAFAYVTCTFASRVAKSGGSRPPPCISSCLSRTRVVAVWPPLALRLSYGVYTTSLSYLFFSFCTARSSLASVRLAGSAASPPPRVLKDIKSALKR